MEADLRPVPLRRLREARVGGVGDPEGEGRLRGGRQGGNAGVGQQAGVFGCGWVGGGIEERDAGAEEEVVEEDAALWEVICTEG